MYTMFFSSVPDSNLFIQIMPIVMRVDFATSSWLDAFASTLSMTIVKKKISIRKMFIFFSVG